MAWFAVKKFWSLLGKPSDYEGGEDHGFFWLDFWRAGTLHIVWHGSAGPHPASYQESQTKITISELWFVDPQRFAGCFQEKWMPGLHRLAVLLAKALGTTGQKRTESYDSFFLRFPSSIHLWCWDYQRFQGQKLFLYKSLAAIPSSNSSGCPNTVTTPCTATKGPVKPFIAEKTLVNFTTDTLNSEGGLAWSYQSFLPI